MILKGKLYLNSDGLTAQEYEELERITIALIIADIPSNQRCTFFTLHNGKRLPTLLKRSACFEDGRVEGNDNNPFNQHYWLAMTTTRTKEAVLIDPILGYAGIESYAAKVLCHNDAHYYKHKRRCNATMGIEDGGIRVKTMSL